ncbi:hypothetical protein [Halopenitus persicus]|uniref:Uncharacterized protein n=1 Tax=Halopenitus persicus TaxID=1048396 RepID=A0A1H3NFD3_9EURY|nr:hypothetical protein [Halopenitus persicus]SDY87632.1 hypothetical protein SAMN05216564_11295 [Halopenitus persicus]
MSQQQSPDNVSIDEIPVDIDNTQSAEVDSADVPTKATIPIKEIKDHRYYYRQWREGEKVTSKYKGPFNPDE